MAAPLVHQVNVKATPDTIYKAVSTAQGLQGFWTSESTAEPKVASIATLHARAVRGSKIELPPADIVTRIHTDMVKALAEPEGRAQFDAQGLEAVGMPPAEFAKFVAKESEFITGLAKKIASGK